MTSKSARSPAISNSSFKIADDTSFKLVLPETVRARSGVLFDPRNDLWAWRDSVANVSLNFTPMRSYLNDHLIDALKLTLCWYASTHSPTTLGANRSQFLHFLKTIHKPGEEPKAKLQGIDMLNYQANLTPNTAYYLGRVAAIMRRWHLLGYSGVEDALLLLNEMRIGGGIKGAAVMTMCPLMGPFSNIEQESIQAAVDEAFTNKEIEESHYLFTWLLMAFGQRPEQYAAMKVCDVSQILHKDGTETYTLQIPRVKQGEKPRSSFKVRPLIPQIGRPLWNYVQHIKIQFSNLLSDINQAPLFPQKRGGALAHGFEYHQTAASLGAALSHVLNKLDVLSERTGVSLHITPIRFRRTFGTRAAQEGHGELVIAELLDHSDTQHVGVYVAAIPEIAARIDKALAMELAPLAQAFKGIVINNESMASRGSDPTSRIRDLRIDQDGKAMGSCGQFSACGYARPIACYTCRNFEPWLDGPHEAVLNYLLGRREKNLASLGPRMASINDRTILAVAEVIQLCQAAHEERATNNG